MNIDERRAIIAHERLALTERRLALEVRRFALEEQRMATEEANFSLGLRNDPDEERRASDERRLVVEERRIDLEENREARLRGPLCYNSNAPAPKRDSKITEAQRTWSRCWFGSGEEMLANSQDPYIGRSALSEMLRSDGVSEPKIKAALDPSKPSLIGALIDSELIRFSGHGWVAVGVFADELRVQQKK